MMCDWAKDNPPAQVKAGPCVVWKQGYAGNWIDHMNMFMNAPALRRGETLLSRSLHDHASVPFEKNRTKFRHGNWGQQRHLGCFVLVSCFRNSNSHQSGASALLI